ncbi:hypothetical protein AB6A40_006277 [Gnathostoma spinigerum]|uniref:Uncharacterized protein n=1 Tax=Gnathostoma spinigerum TaxID=75299 RepID=A0ABD6EHY7_9BILA
MRSKTLSIYRYLQKYRNEHSLRPIAEATENQTASSHSNHQYGMVDVRKKVFNVKTPSKTNVPFHSEHVNPATNRKYQRILKGPFADILNKSGRSRKRVWTYLPEKSLKSENYRPSSVNNAKWISENGDIDNNLTNSRRKSSTHDSSATTFYTNTHSISLSDLSNRHERAIEDNDHQNSEPNMTDTNNSDGGDEISTNNLQPDDTPGSKSNVSSIVEQLATNISTASDVDEKGSAVILGDETAELISGSEAGNDMVTASMTEAMFSDGEMNITRTTKTVINTTKSGYVGGKNMTKPYSTRKPDTGEVVEKKQQEVVWKEPEGQKAGGYVFNTSLTFRVSFWLFYSSIFYVFDEFAYS